MDIKEILDILYEAVVLPDLVYKVEARRAFQETQPYYDRLCQALGDEEGDRLWSAVVAIGTNEQDCAFRSGLRLGLRLMALCL